jgi:hypothetical protein
MRQILSCVLIFLISLSCNNNAIKKPSKPDDLIGKKVMVNLLYDMAVISAAKGSNKKVLENNGVFPEAYIFEKYNIDSLQFAESNTYYSFNPEQYQEIYKQVKLKIEVERKIHQKVLDIEKKVRDSISKTKRKKRDSIAEIAKKTSDSTKKILKNTTAPLKKDTLKKAKGLLEKAQQ